MFIKLEYSAEKMKEFLSKIRIETGSVFLDIAFYILIHCFPLLSFGRKQMSQIPYN